PGLCFDRVPPRIPSAAAMSEDTIISVEGLGKMYRISRRAEQQRYVALRDVLADRTKSAARRLWSLLRRSNHSAAGPGARPFLEDFWALKDVGFEIKAGEV